MKGKGGRLGGKGRGRELQPIANYEALTTYKK